MILGLIALSLTHSTAMLVGASLLYGLGYGAVQPSLQTWAVNRGPADRKAAANGLFMSAIDLGYLVGAVTLGQVAEVAGYAMMYGYSALAMLAFLAVYWRELRRPVDKEALRISDGPAAQPAPPPPARRPPPP
jgi:predicted MFS family arabinose efflux permease